jgi:hypothetical protein
MSKAFTAGLEGEAERVALYKLGIGFREEEAKSSGVKASLFSGEVVRARVALVEEPSCSQESRPLRLCPLL